jgi:methyltransferase (TIGR00027 family)
MMPGWVESRAHGFDQLVVLGAGLDTLGVRAAADGAVRVVEVDHPATQRIKREILGPRSSLQLIEAKLDEPGGIGAAAETLDPGRASFIVIEGLLMYLSAAEVRRLLDEVRSLNVPALRIAFTFMEHWSSGKIGFMPRSRLVEWWLHFRGEPFRWWIATGELAAFLKPHGLQLQAVADGRALGGTLLGESVAIAQPMSANALPPRAAATPPRAAP